MREDVDNPTVHRGKLNFFIFQFWPSRRRVLTVKLFTCYGFRLGQVKVRVFLETPSA